MEEHQMVTGKRRRVVRLGLIAAVAALGSLSTTGSAFAGAFVIGAQNAQISAHVTFWGAQWWQNNGLGDDAAPPSFKGYADTATPVCGETWTTSPGNSSAAPDAIGEVVPVVVSSQIDKSGSVISGDTTAIALVAVDAGYADNPGHPGSGTIVDLVACGGDPTVS
jgi:hypothetical protein